MSILLNAVYLALSIILLPGWLWQTVRGTHDVGGVVPRFFGIAPKSVGNRPVIWMHGASVGELLALRPLIERFEASQGDSQLVVSTYTRDGLKVAGQTWPQLSVFYLPFDFSWAVRRVYRSVNPAMLMLSELELWPNLLLEAKRSRIPVAVVGSRINDTELAFFHRMRWLLKPALPAIHWWGAQTQQDAERICTLAGTSETVVEVTGSLKCDAVPAETTSIEAAELKKQMGFAEDEQILVAGSTHAPEEEQILDAFCRLHHGSPHLRLVLVPRQRRRCREIIDDVRARGLPAATWDQTSSKIETSQPVTVVSSIGELTTIWAIADFCFVGGTLAPDRGGQSMIEPALLSKPMCFGPNVWNFQNFARGLLNADGAREVRSKQDLIETITCWLNTPQQAINTGAAALRFAESQRGATDKTMTALQQLLPSQLSAPPRSQIG